MASPTQWTWVWASSRSWWWTGKPGMLQSMGWQRLGQDWEGSNHFSFGLICRYPRLEQLKLKRTDNQHLGGNEWSFPCDFLFCLLGAGACCAFRLLLLFLCRYKGSYLCWLVSSVPVCIFSVLFHPKFAWNNQQWGPLGSSAKALKELFSVGCFGWTRVWNGSIFNAPSDCSS